VHLKIIVNYDGFFRVRSGQVKHVHGRGFELDAAVTILVIELLKRTRLG
jgi:hypothetical protein